MSRFSVTRPLSSLVILMASTVIVAAPLGTVPVVLDTEANINDFVKASGTAQRAAQPDAPAGNTMLSLPSVYIYAPSGDLVYHGGGSDEDTVKNLAMLEGLPDTAKHLPPIAGTPKLSAMLDIVPAYKNEEGKIIGDGHYVVYVVTVELGHVTKTQKAVADLRTRAKILPIDTLLLRLQRE